jgi:hypothetical protein
MLLLRACVRACVRPCGCVFAVASLRIFHTNCEMNFIRHTIRFFKKFKFFILSFISLLDIIQHNGNIIGSSSLFDHKCISLWTNGGFRLRQFGRFETSL